MRFQRSGTTFGCASGVSQTVIPESLKPSFQSLRSKALESRSTVGSTTGFQTHLRWSGTTVVYGTVDWNDVWVCQRQTLKPSFQGLRVISVIPEFAQQRSGIQHEKTTWNWIPDATASLWNDGGRGWNDSQHVLPGLTRHPRFSPGVWVALRSPDLQPCIRWRHAV